MTPACGRCGARAIAHVNGVGRQCLMCGEEHAQDDRGGAVAVEVDAKVVQDQEDAGKVTVRAAAKALGLRYKLVLQWARTGELPATDWDPRQSRRGRRVRLANLEELVKDKRTIECAHCGATAWREELPKGKQRRFCPPPAKCKERYWSRLRPP